MRYGLILAALAAGCGGGGKADTGDSGVDTDLTPDDTAPDEPAPTDSPDTTGTITAPEPPLAIIGSYVDVWAVVHEITESTWTQTYAAYPSDVFHLLAYDNDARWVVAHNDAANYFNPGLYSRFDWVEEGGELFYCHTAFAEASEADAIAAPAADATDITTGCGGFSWTHLTP